jgi:hypothetical protein
VTRPPPIGVFAHARPRLLAATLEALARCDGFSGARVHVFCDAPTKEGASAAVTATERVAAGWCRRHRARLVRRATNHGLRNLTEGLTELCATEGAAISLEDDHLPAAAALRFLDRALVRYRDEDRVFQVCAYRPGGPLPSAPETFFLPFPMPIGWGTWQRAWDRFSWACPEAEHVLNRPALRRAFDLDGAYPAAALLARARAGTFHSYFIRWYCALFDAGGLALCTRDALVRNAGLDSGLHGHDDASGQRARFHNGAWSPAACADNWAFPATTSLDPAVLEALRTQLRRFAEAVTVAP